MRLFKLVLIAVVATMSFSGTAANENQNYSYSAVLKQYEEQKPLAEQILDKSRLLALRAEKRSSDDTASAKTFLSDVKTLETESAQLGNSVFAEPFGACAVLPTVLNDYTLSLFANVGQTVESKKAFQQQYKDCKSAITHKPEDKSDLAVVEVWK